MARWGVSLGLILLVPWVLDLTCMRFCPPRFWDVVTDIPVFFAPPFMVLAGVVLMPVTIGSRLVWAVLLTPAALLIATVVGYVWACGYRGERL